MGRLDLRDPVRDEDFDGPEFHDCETAAHLRECGFCRAVMRTNDVERIVALLDEVMGSEFFHGSEPQRIWFRLPKPPQRQEVRRKWWERLLGW